MIPEDLSIYKSCIDDKMTKRTRAKECLKLMHNNIYGTLVSMHRDGMGISSLLVMITLGLDMYIGNLMPWIHSLNLRRDWITYWVYIPSHFD